MIAKAILFDADSDEASQPNSDTTTICLASCYYYIGNNDFELSKATNAAW